jgi:phosphoglycerate dehydrogenase-like enzyme
MVSPARLTDAMAGSHYGRHSSQPSRTEQGGITMRVAVIGSGHMGSAFARRLSETGY